MAGRVGEPLTSETPAAVGVFDSGVGGLTVVAALHRLLPALPVRYIADTACFPYGERSPEEVAERSLILGQRLLDEGCALLVVACNTASSAALERLRERFSVPVVGMEPPLKPAVERSRSGHVAVLVTTATAEGARLARLHDVHAGESRVRTIPMPGLADLVEAGELAGPRVDAILRDALAALGADGIDQVALGCTHYGFLRDAIVAVLGPGIEVIDAAEPVARRVYHQLEAHAIPIATGAPTTVSCVVSGDTAAFEAALTGLRSAGAALPPLRLTREAAV